MFSQHPGFLHVWPAPFAQSDTHASNQHQPVLVAPPAHQAWPQGLNLLHSTHPPHRGHRPLTPGAGPPDSQSCTTQEQHKLTCARPATMSHLSLSHPYGTDTQPQPSKTPRLCPGMWRTWLYGQQDPLASHSAIHRPLSPQCREAVGLAGLPSAWAEASSCRPPRLPRFPAQDQARWGLKSDMSPRSTAATDS